MNSLIPNICKLAALELTHDSGRSQGPLEVTRSRLSVDVKFLLATNVMRLYLTYSLGISACQDSDARIKKSLEMLRPHSISNVEPQPPEINNVATSPQLRRSFDNRRFQTVTRKPRREGWPRDARAGYQDSYMKMRYTLPAFATTDTFAIGQSKGDGR